MGHEGITQVQSFLRLLKVSHLIVMGVDLIFAVASCFGTSAVLSDQQCECICRGKITQIQSMTWVPCALGTAGGNLTSTLRLHGRQLRFGMLDQGHGHAVVLPTPRH